MAGIIMGTGVRRVPRSLGCMLRGWKGIRRKLLTVMRPPLEETSAIVTVCWLSHLDVY